VVTGFFGATHDGRIATLRRNSSDYSGAIVAHVVHAQELVIWTDVDGVHTANPKQFAEARLFHEMSYGRGACVSSKRRQSFASASPAPGRAN
jgi:aspartokinase